MPLPTLTIASLTATIAQRLGRSGRRVELKPEDYLQAITRATMKFAEVYPQHAYTAIPISVTQSKYIVTQYATQTPDLNALGVLDVTFYNNGGKFAYYPYPDQATDHYLIQGQLKEQELIYGDLPEWDAMREIDPNDNIEKLFLYVYFNVDSFIDRAGRIPNFLSIEYAWAIEPTDDPRFGICRIRYDWRDWFERYCVAQARIVLGEIRNKFGGIPGPQDGTTLAIDGKEQIARGEEERDKLEEEIRKRARQLPIMYDN
jgi:hypothetical protein